MVSGGIVATILGTMLALVRIAIAAERRRADDWRDTAETREETNAVLSANIEKLISSVEQLAASQREILSLLRRSGERDRDAA